MKKLAICCLVIAAIAVFTPAAAQATTFCYHLTNFCDGLQATNIFVGGIEATEEVGYWDWVCSGSCTGTLQSGGNNAFGTQPLYPFSGGTPAGFNANFKFKPLILMFDLYGTFDGATTFAFQTNQPYTRTKGPCCLAGVAPKTNGKRPSTIR
jgi:hypothetical protein